MTDTFTLDVENFADLAIEKSTAVLRQSYQDVLEDAQKPRAKGGRMRVDTGFLRNSHVSGIAGQGVVEGADSYVLTAASVELGDVIEGGWTANYAEAREFGARGQEPDMFMRGAAQNWNGFVEKNAAKAGGQ